jgi:ABC-type transport system involved in multi-copper enzyme maturation permease subunit
MTRVAVIALNTFKENVRDKILFNLVVFGLLLIGSSILLSTLTIGEQTKIIKDIGLAGINLFGAVIAVFVGIGLVSKELERRTIYTIIAKPLPRYQFLLGKYFGLTLTLFVNIAIMVVGFFLILLFEQMVPDAGLMEAILLIFVELLVLTAVAVMFSTFTTPTLSATFTLAIYVIGHLTDDLKALAAKLPQGLTKVFLDLLYYILPNLSNFNIKGQAVHGIPVEPQYLLAALAYGLAYGAGILVLACVIFQRRDFR